MTNRLAIIGLDERHAFAGTVAGVLGVHGGTGCRDVSSSAGVVPNLSFVIPTV